MIAFEINIFLLVKFIIIPISMSFYLNIVLANEGTVRKIQKHFKKMFFATETILSVVWLHVDHIIADHMCCFARFDTICTV